MDLGIKGKIALVTGAGKGIGRETAMALAKEGVRICVNDIDEENGMKVCEEIKALGVDGIFVKGDISCQGDVMTVFEHIRKSLGTVDILINNAGISSKTAFEDISAESFEKILRVNLLGTFLCTKEAFKDMKEKRWGRIVNLSSMAGRFGANKASVDYAATKGGIISMTLTLAKKMGPYNVTVNCVAPGRIDTDLTRALPQEVIDGIIEQIPLKRLGSTEEVANVITFLASEPAAYERSVCRRFGRIYCIVHIGSFKMKREVAQMKINESKMEQIAGIVLFILSLLLFFVIIPMQVKDVAAQGVPPRFLPQLVTLLIMVMSVPLFIGGWRKKNKENQKMYSLSMKELKLVALTLISVTVTIVLYMIIGFVPASILFLAFLQYKFGQRKKLRIVIVAIVFPIVIYLFFQQVLMISLPMGMFYY